MHLLNINGYVYGVPKLHFSFNERVEEAFTIWYFIFFKIIKYYSIRTLYQLDNLFGKLWLGIDFFFLNTHLTYGRNKFFDVVFYSA